MNLPKNNCSFCKHLSFNGPDENYEYNVKCIINDECPTEDYICEHFEKEYANISNIDLDNAYNNFLETALRMDFNEYYKTNYYNLLKEKALKYYNNECSICSNSSNLNMIHLNCDSLGRESLSDITIICEDCLNKK